jgi:outer membrane protein assembly factor BamD (BamD/ComL family)
MSSISSISGVASAANPYLAQLTSALQGNNFGQTIKDFQAIGTALQAGNLSSAKTALAALQKDFPAGLQSGASQLFGKNSQANTDFQKLTSTLQSGDMTGAQKAFASLEADLQASSTSAGSTGSTFSNTLNSVLGNLNATH